MKAITLLLVFTFFAVAPCRAQPLPEDKLKTAFIYQFTKYINWPREDDLSEFSIVLVGDMSLWKSLEELARKKKIKDRPVQLQSADSHSDLTKTHIVIVSGDEVLVSHVLKRAKGSHALTISQGEGLAERGVMINFYVTAEGRLRFEINRKAVDSAGLVISSQLLKMARIIE